MAVAVSVATTPAGSRSTRGRVACTRGNRRDVRDLIVLPAPQALALQTNRRRLLDHLRLPRLVNRAARVLPGSTASTITSRWTPGPNRSKPCGRWAAGGSRLRRPSWLAMSTEKPPSRLPGPGFADLEQLTWAFSQRNLLTTARFRDQCGQRGAPILLDEQLEALHRQGVLVPLVRRDDELLEEPAAVGFRPWRTYPRFNQFYYSPYQLLAAPGLSRFLTHMVPRRRSVPRRLLARLVGRRRRRQVVFDLDLTFPEGQFDLSRLPSRELVIALSALEARYLPPIVHRVHAPRPLDLHTWPDYANGFDPNAMLAWLGWQPEQLKAAAYQLLGHASSIDPQQRWHRLARLAEPERWGELRGLALAANDHRIAAELLLLFYEDLVELRAAPPLEQLPPRHQRVWHPLDERLATDRNELEEVLTEFGLSPHPSVVLAVEGETEELTVGRIIDLLVPAGQRGHIRVRNLHGARRDLTLLADELARPLIGAPVRGNWLTLRQPPTRLLVAVDPEEKYATTALCDEQRRKLLDRVDQTLRFGGVAVDRADLEALVEIQTWDAPFEFAHFTDDELAQAALAQRRPGHQITVQQLAAAFDQIRTTTKKLDLIDASLRNHLDKVELADALWPVLKAKIEACTATGDFSDVPVAAAVWRAAELARQPRRNVGVRPAS
jgi:hypothetical protein